MPLLPPQEEESLCCCSMRSLLQDQFSINFSNMRPSHGLWFFTSCSCVRYLPWGQSFRNCFKVGPLWGHKSCQETFSPQTQRSFQDLVQHGALPQAAGRFVLPSCRPPCAPGGQSASLCPASWAAGKSQLQYLEHLLPLLLSWLWCLQSCFSHIFSVLTSLAAIASPQQLFLLKYVIPDILLPWLKVSGLASGILEPAGIVFARHGVSFHQLLKEEAIPVASLLPGPCRANPYTYEHHRSLNISKNKSNLKFCYRSAHSSSCTGKTCQLCHRHSIEHFLHSSLLLVLFPDSKELLITTLSNEQRTRHSLLSFYPCCITLPIMYKIRVIYGSTDPEYQLHSSLHINSTIHKSPRWVVSFN